MGFTKGRRLGFFLRIREDDASEWSTPTLYATRKARDKSAAINRIIGGYRTHSYNEWITVEQMQEEASE